MEVVLEKSTPTNATLTVKMDKSDYQPKVDKTIKDYSRKANLKGFRPGKVPPQVIQRMYGKSIVIDEVNNLLSDTVNNYIRDNKLAIVGDPKIDREKTETIDWNTQTDFEFSYELGLASDFEVAFESLPTVSKYTIQAGETELNEAIENLRERFSGQTNPEVSEVGDMLYGDLKQVEGEFNTKTAIPFARIKEEAQALFIGLKKEDTVTFDIRNTFTEDRAVALLTGLKDEEAAELTGDFTLTIEDITRKAPAEINQEFFDKVLGPEKANGEEEFKAQLLDIINDNYVRESNALLRRDIDEMLLNTIKIDLPEAFLKDWLLKVNEGKFTEEQIDAEFPQFLRSTKLGLIKNNISDQLEVKVESNELIGAAENMIREQFGFLGNDLDERMQEAINKMAMNYLMNKEEDNYSKVFNQVMDAKVFAGLKEKLSFEEKTIDVEQFKEIVNSLV
ncbi:MAG: trigger factor [Spirosomaceae bacterium]|nr:trigger factor [Spirosomataceae bacterium]